MMRYVVLRYDLTSGELAEVYTTKRMTSTMFVGQKLAWTAPTSIRAGLNPVWVSYNRDTGVEGEWETYAVLE